MKKFKVPVCWIVDASMVVEAIDAKSAVKVAEAAIKEHEESHDTINGLRGLMYQTIATEAYVPCKEAGCGCVEEIPE